MSGESNDPLVAGAAALLRGASRVVVFTGAGISTDSGIPDFRGPNGVWTRNPLAEKTSTLSWYLGDPEVRKAAWENRERTFGRPLAPNGGHLAVADIDRMGKLSAVVTQNVDGLHQDAGVPDEKVLEVHGTVKFARCWACNDRRPMGEYIDLVRAGDPDPACVRCGGIVKSDAILFEQALDEHVISRAFAEAEACDVLFAVGSTLGVSPANDVVRRARGAGKPVVIVNGGPTVMDHYASIFITGSITPVMQAIVAAAR